MLSAGRYSSVNKAPCWTVPVSLSILVLVITSVERLTKSLKSSSSSKTTISVLMLVRRAEFYIYLQVICRGVASIHIYIYIYTYTTSLPRQPVCVCFAPVSNSYITTGDRAITCTSRGL